MVAVLVTARVGRCRDLEFIQRSRRLFVVCEYNYCMLERLQKILSAQGIASRRKAEEYIQAGLVKVNGAVAKIGDKADPEKDRIEVDGKVLKERQEMLYYLLHKPVNVVTSNIERWTKDTPRILTEGQKRAQKRKGASGKTPQPLKDVTVRDILPKHLQGKIFPVGRLDKDSSGLLLMTNDGVLAHRLTHPKFDHEKEYEVEVINVFQKGAIEKLEQGMLLDGRLTKPARVKKMSPSKIRIALTEGRNRQVRRMCEQVGSPVKTLQRVRIMTLEDPALKVGQLRKLTQSEGLLILQSVGINYPS